MPFTQMHPLGISLIGIGLALVCAGLAFAPRTPRHDPAALDGHDAFRTILDALDEEDRRNEQRDFDQSPAKLKPADPVV